MTDRRLANQRYQDDRSDPPPCPRCQGTGEVPNTCPICDHHNDWSPTRTCPDCAGLGVKNGKAKGG